MLLTSGQVSVALSSAIIFIFSTALFLSGYVLQQQTLRDLRAAIKPPPRPTHTLVYLPPQFNTEPTAAPGIQGHQSADANEALEASGETLVEVTTPEDNPGEENMRDELNNAAPKRGKSSKNRHPHQDTVISEVTPDERAIMRADVLPPVPESADRLPESVASNPTGAGGAAQKLEPQKPLSRAERRKKIKEEIMQVSEGEGPKGYRRRMW